MLGGYRVFVQSQVGYQPVLSLLLLQLQGGKLQLKLLGTPLSMCSCSQCCSFYVFSLYVLWLWALLFCVLLFWGPLTICALALIAPRSVTSCSWQSLLCVLLLWTFLTLCARYGHSLLYVLLLSTFLTL
jgi:hypothetical protein